MTTKQHIIEKINQVEDPMLLHEIDMLLSSFIDSPSLTPEFSEEEISAVQEGYHEYKTGKKITQQEADTLFEEWAENK
tara:strand:- start:9172 stop:9405 length:234 start_codon:yes stop_codon:yes gene_type:complete